LAEGEDVIIHGTLSSTSYADELLAELDGFGDERLIIYDIEVSADRAVEQATQRWWRVREAEIDPLGGRFVPPSAIRAYYPANSPKAVTAANALVLRDRAAELAWDVELTTMTP